MAVKFRIPAALTTLILVFLQPCGPAFPQRLSATPSDRSSRVRIGVFGLFHPRQLVISAPPGQALIVRAERESVILEKSSGPDSAIVGISENRVLVKAGTKIVKAMAVTAGSRGNEPADFVLTIPGKITRRYHGQLEVTISSGALNPVVNMDLETAVASVLAAESAPDTPLEAVKTQAVATRSYFVAGRGRHSAFDFCDTTHCQFLREPPVAGSLAARATAATRDLVLMYCSQPFAAMYTRSCSGQTRTPAELGLRQSRYPYYSVECKYCRAHPARWTSRIPPQDAAALHSSDEPARLNIARRLGWSTVQSTDFVMKDEKGEVILEGKGQGHGIGLCQAGARAMAADGADFRQILQHYYPNATVAGH